MMENVATGTFDVKLAPIGSAPLQDHKDYDMKTTTRRPPVLAHQRFVADREAFVGLDLSARFERIFANNLWGAPASISGLGSELDATVRIRLELPLLLRELVATSLLDAPCGDAGWISGVPLDLDYTGVDIVPDLIARLQSSGDERRYLLADITRDPLPRADAILCRDALVHLSFRNITAAIANMRRSGATWLITTNFPDLKHNDDCEDGDWRALNLEHEPFGWPAPMYLLSEGCTENDGAYADKALGVWRFADLPIQR